MGQSKQQFMDQRDYERNGSEQTLIIPDTEVSIDIVPGKLNLSRADAKNFHDRMRTMILETGKNAFEYVAAIKFFSKVDDLVFGDSQAGTPQDKELINYLRDEIQKYGKSHTTPNNVKYECCETGTKYDFSQCNDQVYAELCKEIEELKGKIKQREEFLKAVPASGIEFIDVDTGVVHTVYPPSKSSKSSIKITLPRS